MGLLNKYYESDAYSSKAKGEEGHKPKVKISGPGIVHVKSSEIVKTDEARRQIRILGKLKEQGSL